MMQSIFGMPEAHAQVYGNDKNRKIRGDVYFYGVHDGTLVVAEIYGLPSIMKMSNGNFYGFHIHEGEHCMGNGAEPFLDTGAHYDPRQEEHPKHAGDLPPLLANDGVAWSAVYTDRFYPEEVIGRTVVIHGMGDDFHSQPSGNSGVKIACGEIVA